MAVGRPVVAADAGGLPAIVEHERTGLLVTPRDVPAFATGTLRLLGDRALRERLGRAGRRRAEALFGVDAHADAVLQAYRTVVPG
jgi:glycosyltransferase involved in cell wall biosynthesis